METISKLQIVAIAAPAVIVAALLSYKAGEFNNRQHYINYGAEQHWQGKIDCGRVGKEIFCARTGDE
jgi:hypothetical protein